MSRLEELIPDDLFEQFCDTFAPGDNASFRLALEELCISVRAEAQREALEKAAEVAENPNCMTSGVSPLDQWCKGCAKAIRALLPSEVNND